MAFVTEAILGGILYDVLKSQAVVAANDIKEKLKGWILGDETAERLAQLSAELKIDSDVSEAKIVRILEGSPEIKQLLASIPKATNTTIINQTHSGSGDNIGRDKIGK